MCLLVLERCCNGKGEDRTDVGCGDVDVGIGVCFANTPFFGKNSVVYGIFFGFYFTLFNSLLLSTLFVRLGWGGRGWERWGLDLPLSFVWDV